MNETLWQMWPWITLFLFASLVGIFWQLTLPRCGNPCCAGSGSQPVGVAILFLLAASLIFGAAVCIVLSEI